MVQLQAKKQIRKVAAPKAWERCLPYLAFPLGLLWMEIVVKFWDFRVVWNRGLLYTALFTCSVGVVLTIVCALASPSKGRILALLLMGLLTVFYMVQAVYYTVMRTVLAVYSVSVAKDATEFWRVGLLGTWRTVPALLLLAVPFILFCVFGKKFLVDTLEIKKLLVMVLASVLFYGAALAAIFFSHGGILSPWSLYKGQNNPELSLSHFGVLTSFRLDMKRMMFPPGEEGVDYLTVFPDLAEKEKLLPLQEEANVMEIDFAALAERETDETLQALHAYFATRTPTLKNEYTGFFEGKNLIMITAEAFNSWAVDPELTPTLYRLSQEGFVFKNFYTPLWWVSTSDGEYVSCTSLIPKSGEQSFGASADNSLYFCLGNQLGQLGYDTRAYHNHTYTYYARDLTHPNMGYVYKGIGNGLRMNMTWPGSDLEMMEFSLEEYIENTPFHAYYMTVSGHLQYNFEENDMSAKHREKVSHLDLSEEAQAYLACQIELDQALAYTLNRLEEAGELENTVICLYGDHYPYGLSERAMDELSGIENVIGSSDLYRSTLILWSGDMEEPIEVTKPCSNLDLLPTLSNLFGLEFDSRLFMGQDIFADQPGLVIFSDTSYITGWGEYIAQDDVFVPERGYRVSEEYPAEMLQLVQDKFLYSGKILMTDYYRVLGFDWNQ